MNFIAGQAQSACRLKGAGLAQPFKDRCLKQSLAMIKG